LLVKGFSPSPSWQSQMERGKAFYIAQAGIEYALAQIEYGGFPVVEKKAFDGGYFSTSINNKQRFLSVKSEFKNEESKYSIHIPHLASDCVEQEGVQKNSQHITIYIRKKCLSKITLETFQVFLKDPSHDLPALESVTFDGNVLRSFSQEHSKSSYLSLTLQKLALADADRHTLTFSFRSNFAQENLNMVLGFSDRSEILLKPLAFK